MSTRELRIFRVIQGDAVTELIFLVVNPCLLFVSAGAADKVCGRELSIGCGENGIRDLRKFVPIETRCGGEWLGGNAIRSQN